jgi:hypothetical protein
MRRPSNRLKRALKISELERQLSCYALAATAAGVGALASQACEAEIIYTKAHRQIGPNTTLKLDLNHDGIVDFTLKDTFHFSSFFTSYGRLSVLPAGQKNRAWGHTLTRRDYASALFAGARVGPKGQFLPGAGLMAESTFNGGARPPGSDSCTGPWANVSNRYLGLKFIIDGEVHFGWARLNVACSGRRVTALLTGYAYETVPNQPIVTGKEKGTDDSDSTFQQSRTRQAALQPASLGRLAQGAAGLTSWRRKQRRENGL